MSAPIRVTRPSLINFIARTILGGQYT
jgi:hypothetical protein